MPKWYSGKLAVVKQAIECFGCVNMYFYVCVSMMLNPLLLDVCVSVQRQSI